MTESEHWQYIADSTKCFDTYRFIYVLRAAKKAMGWQELARVSGFSAARLKRWSLNIVHPNIKKQKQLITRVHVFACAKLKELAN